LHIEIPDKNLQGCIHYQINNISIYPETSSLTSDLPCRMQVLPCSLQWPLT